MTPLPEREKRFVRRHELVSAAGAYAVHIIMPARGDFFLCGEHLAANLAMASLGQARFGTGRLFGGVDDLGVPRRRDRARLHLAAARTDALLFALRFARRGNCHRPFAEAVRVRLVRVDGVIRVDGVVRVCWIARVDGLRGAVDVAGGRRAGDDAERAAKDKREAQRRKQKLFHTLPPLVFIMYFASSV